MNNRQSNKLSVDDFEPEEFDRAENEPRNKFQNRSHRKRRIGCSCSTLIGLFFFFLILFCVFSVWAFITKPPAVWNPVVNFVNAGVTYPEYEEFTEKAIQEEIAQQAKNIGENNIYISEEALTTLARSRFPQFKDLVLDLEENKLNLFWKLDHSDNPMFGYAEASFDTDKNIVVNKIGTPRIALPEFVNSGLTSIIHSLLSDGTGENNIIGSIFAGGENLKINSVELQKDKLHLNLNIELDLFSQ